MRTPSGALSGVAEAGAENGDAPDGVEGGVKASDCHRLLRDYMADEGIASLEEANTGRGGEGDGVEPR